MLKKEIKTMNHDITLFCSTGSNLSICLLIVFWPIILKIKDEALVKESAGAKFEHVRKGKLEKEEDDEADG